MLVAVEEIGRAAEDLDEGAQLRRDLVDERRVGDLRAIASRIMS